jgi:hypothetical protein
MDLHRVLSDLRRCGFPHAGALFASITVSTRALRFNPASVTVRTRSAASVCEAEAAYIVRVRMATASVASSPVGSWSVVADVQSAVAAIVV